MRPVLTRIASTFRNPRNTRGWMDEPLGGKKRWPAACARIPNTTQQGEPVCKTLQWAASSAVLAALVPLAPPPTGCPGGRGGCRG